MKLEAILRDLNTPELALYVLSVLAYPDCVKRGLFFRQLYKVLQKRGLDIGALLWAREPGRTMEDLYELLREAGY